MARTSGIVYLTIVFVVLLVLLPYVKTLFPTISGFENLGMNMSCEQGLKPCPEGYFCEQSTCVAILPRFNINEVKPNSGY
jgi:hypothetical protein